MNIKKLRRKPNFLSIRKNDRRFLLSSNRGLKMLQETVKLIFKILVRFWCLKIFKVNLVVKNFVYEKKIVSFVGIQIFEY